MGRRRARELALQVLFQIDVGKVKPERALSFILNEFHIQGDTAIFARSLVEGTLLHQREIDHYIEKYSEDWDLPRMANVDRNILRLGFYEMFYSDTPVNVAIDEALELAKTFSDEDSPRFINGILGKIAQELPILKRNASFDNNEP